MHHLQAVFDVDAATGHCQLSICPTIVTIAAAHRTFSWQNLVMAIGFFYLHGVFGITMGFHR
jgi:fatty-acid desaturase